MVWTEGEKVGAYILGKQLGQGGMATVYLGHHPQLDREVAIKVMHQNFLDDEGFVARFQREAQIVAKLTHPHIVPVFDFDEHAGQPYLVMKYIQGWTLKKQLIKDPLDLEGILRVMSAIGDALNYAHEQGILHRDIKPSNIVIDRDGVPYLADFGLARLASSGESTMSADMLLGTPHYISPEQARGVKQLDGRTDIYSLGVVLYELLVGKVPFTGDSAFSIVHDHIYSPLPQPTRVNPELPESVEEVLYRALEKQANDRYDTANDLIHDLTQAIKQSDLTELDPHRADVAEVSLAKIREEYDDQPTITPVIGVRSAIPTGSSSIRTATMYTKKPFHEQERFWLISGCGSLLVIVFLSFGVLLGMLGNIQELSALSLTEGDGVSVFETFGFADTLEIFDSFTRYEVGIETIEEMPVLVIPLMPLDDLPEVANDPVESLLRARSLYESEMNDEARQEIIAGTPENTETLVLYYVSATRVATEVDDIEAAVMFSIVASEAAIESQELFGAIRPVALEFIYENVGEVRVTDIVAIIREMNADSLLSNEVMQQIANSNITSFATVRSLIINENFALGRGNLAGITEATPIDPELNLLRAELQILSGNSDDANTLLNSIIRGGDTPLWVKNRAEELQNQLE